MCLCMMCFGMYVYLCVVCMSVCDIYVACMSECDVVFVCALYVCVCGMCICVLCTSVGGVYGWYGCGMCI